MQETLSDLGRVKLVQLQPTGLIVESGETPTGYLYDSSRLVEVDRLTITSLGIEATTQAGEHLLDIHHINHPHKAYDDDDLICIGFTSHYEAMRVRFGEHMIDGIAGENIIIECEREIWPDDLGRKIIIEDAETGRRLSLELISHASPCQEFSQFAMGKPYELPPADKIKSALQFLGNGRRGYLLVMQDGQEVATVKPGDKVFAVDVA